MTNITLFYVGAMIIYQALNSMLVKFTSGNLLNPSIFKYSLEHDDI